MSTGTVDLRPPDAGIFRLPSSLLAVGRSEPQLVVPLMKQLSMLQSEWSRGRTIGTGAALLTILETMWGVVMFLKFGWIVGRAGLPMALGAVALSVVAQLLSASSLAALATNDMRYTGPLPMVSHNLGSACGITVGGFYFLGLASLAAVEIAGAVDVLDDWLGDRGSAPALGSHYVDQVVLSCLGLALLSLFRAYAPHAVHVLSYVVLVVVVVSIVACLAGLAAGGLEVGNVRLNMATSGGRDWAVFCEVLVFVYPCFLGLFGAANKATLLMSPQVSIPRATIAAPLISGSLYVLIFVLLAGAAPPEVLVANETFMLSAAPGITGFLGSIIVGVGSCLSCLDVGAWVLHSLAKEPALGLLRALGLERLEGGEPRRATAALLVTSMPFLLFSDLGMIATCASVSFLAMYGTINVACFMMSAAQLPSWRPTFKWHGWGIALLGVCVAVGMQVALHRLVACVVLCVAVGTTLVMDNAIGSQEFNTHVGIRGFKYRLALSLLLSVDKNDDSGTFSPEDLDADHWRPQILCYVDSRGSGRERGSPLHRPTADWRERTVQLLTFVHQLKASGGLVVVASVV